MRKLLLAILWVFPLVAHAAPTSSPSMLMFTTSYCQACQDMQPVVEKVVGDCEKRPVEIRVLDVYKSKEDLIAKYRLVGTPTFLFLSKDGQEVARLLGKQTEFTLKQALSALLNEPCPGLDLLVKPVRKKAESCEMHEPDIQESCEPEAGKKNQKGAKPPADQ